LKDPCERNHPLPVKAHLSVTSINADLLRETPGE
jgi:hypothetical protein